MSVVHFGPERPPSYPEFTFDKEIKARQKRFTNISILSASTVHSILSWSSRASRKSTRSTDHAPGQHEQSKTDIIREVIRKWRRLLSKQRDESNSSRHTTTSPALPQQPPDYASLIKTTFSNNPSCALYADDICKQLIRTNEWCRTNQDPGWQEIVASVLPRNRAFEAVIETRKRKISKRGHVKWKLAVADSGASTAGLSWCSPRLSSLHPIELTTDKGLDAAGVARTTSIPTADNQHTLFSSPSSVHALQPATTFVGLSDRAAKNGCLEIIDPTSVSRSKNKSHTACNGTGPVSYSASPVETLGNSNLAQSSSPAGQGGFEPPQQTEPGGAGDGHGGRKKPRLDVSDRTVGKPKLACVYRKMDPQTYGLDSQDYRACALDGWKHPADLLRHLQRKHGEHSCGRCYLYFSAPEECDAHFSQCSLHLRGTREEKWEKLWLVRFPDTPLPENPYFSPPYEVPQLTINPEAGGSRPGQDLPSPSPLPSLPTFTFNSPSPGTQMLSPNADHGGSRPTTPSAAIQDMESRVGTLERQLTLLEQNFEFLHEYVSRLFKVAPDDPSPGSDPTGTFAASFGSTIYGASDQTMLAAPFDDTVSLSVFPPSTTPSTGYHPASEFSAFGASSAHATAPSSQAPSNGEITGVPPFELELQFSVLDKVNANYLGGEPDDADSPMPGLDHEVPLYNLGPQAGSTPGFAFERY
ncbi:hypothetical protein ASPCAL01642 [Aspergillus calidoustus]|uniref:Uncharacterized protein n=1 Tax=Aspergillus calidoustus TaxID=454130 RepID=A0A0U5FRZ7_ASPCI|nr:hypothetical protein ASPCAL01642 [Aspergillus calidoustus]